MRGAVDFREACAAEARELIETGLYRPEIVELGEMMRTRGDKDVLPHQEMTLDVVIVNAVMIRAVRDSV